MAEPSAFVIEFT